MRNDRREERGEKFSSGPHLKKIKTNPNLESFPIWRKGGNLENYFPIRKKLALLSQYGLLSSRNQILYNKKNSIYIATLRYFNINDSLHLIHKVNYSVETFDKASPIGKLGAKLEGNPENVFYDTYQKHLLAQTFLKKQPRPINSVDNAYINKLPISLSKLLKQSINETNNTKIHLASTELTDEKVPSYKKKVFNCNFINPQLEKQYNNTQRRWFKLFESNEMNSVKSRDILLSKIEINLINNINHFNYSYFELEPKKWQVSHSIFSSEFLENSVMRTLSEISEQSNGKILSNSNELQNEYIQIDIWTNGSLSP